jgi:hypothetical protein
MFGDNCTYKNSHSAGSSDYGHVHPENGGISFLSEILAIINKNILLRYPGDHYMSTRT